MTGNLTGFAAAFPLWGRLSDSDRDTLSRVVTRREVASGTVLHNGSTDCVGLFVVESGQLRAFIRSEGGKEVTTWRLLEDDVCLLSASCMLHDIQFDITVEAERDSALWVIPTADYRSLMDSSTVVANYTSQLMASRLTDAMWLIEQVMWKGFDVRLARFLVEEASLEGTTTLSITHERIAAHMGSAREVVTRMLRYFQDEGLVELSRGHVRLADPARLRALAAR
jgi:CRP/FNR family transcriptional regulator